MTRYEFVIRLNRHITADEVDALYGTGCDDATVQNGPIGASLDFSRKAPSLAEALISAVRDIEKVDGLRAVGVACDNIVSLADIAQRAGVSREAVRLWATSQRGPGGFPAPVVVSRNGEKGWDWAHVVAWLHEHKEQQVGGGWPVVAESRGRLLSMADAVLAARQALSSEPDEAVREEFERLLQEA